MPQAIASPEELERFARDLKAYTTHLRDSTSRLNGQFSSLGDTWRDQEHQKFAQEFQQTMRVLEQFMRSADQQIPFLQKKAQRLREYLNQRQAAIMSVSANVKSIQALADLKTSLARYAGDVQETLQQMQRAIEQTRHALQERQVHWRGQVRRCEEMLNQARAALSRCQNSGTTDRDGRRHVPDCRAFEEQVAQAKRRLEEAIYELRTVEQAIQQVEAAVQSYEQQARRLSSFVNSDLKEGQALLERKIGILQGYAAGGLIAGAVGLVANAINSTGSADATTSALNTEGNWQELGIQDVALDEINLSESYVQGVEDFKKVSHEMMNNGLDKLQSTVRPAVEKGANGDYFYTLDAQLGVDYEHGYRRVYDAFYGDEPIRLEKVNGRYQVINGYHRLFVAKQVGLATIPASVTAPVKTEDDGGNIA